MNKLLKCIVRAYQWYCTPANQLVEWFWHNHMAPKDRYFQEQGESFYKRVEYLKPCPETLNTESTRLHWHRTVTIPTVKRDLEFAWKIESTKHLWDTLWYWTLKYLVHSVATLYSFIPFLIPTVLVWILLGPHIQLFYW